MPARQRNRKFVAQRHQRRKNQQQGGKDRQDAEMLRAVDSSEDRDGGEANYSGQAVADGKGRHTLEHFGGGVARQSLPDCD